MNRFMTKAILIATFALLAFVATAPTASADGGQLEVNNQNFALNNFNVSGQSLDTSFQFGSNAWVLLFEGAFGDLNNFTIVSDGTTYTFNNVDIKNATWNWWKGGINIDFTFKDYSTSTNNTVPEPATIFLIGGGLLALALVSSRKALRA
jgi:hypothetical protein